MLTSLPNGWAAAYGSRLAFAVLTWPGRCIEDALKKRPALPAGTYEILIFQGLASSRFQMAF
jgi:hypothetical protein